ncbi:MAG: hypothetical protein KGZ83_01495 [Sulfuricella sp.]|nr:hypothetical protein [Sulfuricella sp.]
MRDYGNMPVMTWEGSKNSVVKARAQIMHGEPLIMEMGADFGIGVDAKACGCRIIDEGKRLLGCEPRCTLSQLAGANGQPALAIVGEAAAQAGLLVDLDLVRPRIIIYD